MAPAPDQPAARQPAKRKKRREPQLDLPFPLHIVKAWGDNVPPDTLTLEELLSVTKARSAAHSDVSHASALSCAPA